MRSRALCCRHMALNSIQSILDKVNPARRQFLERLLLGGAALAALAIPSSELVAQERGGRGGKGKTPAGGKGKGKGEPAKGKGKGDGKGKGKGKGKGDA